MDFHLATPDGDIYLFSYDGQAVQIPLTPAAALTDRCVAEQEKSMPAPTELP